MLSIREGRPEDLKQVLNLIQELAVYEKAGDEVDNTVERMQEDAFGDQPVFKFLVAENIGKIIGTAIYYYSYSTWKGRCIHLEDLVVTESQRNKGVGKRLLDSMIHTAKQEGVNRLTWQVLDWNEPAIEFYKKYKASFDGEWINCKITKADLQNR